MEGMASLFDGGEQASKAEAEAEIEKLHAKIGQFLVEWDFLAKASGLLTTASRSRRSTACCRSAGPPIITPLRLRARRRWR